MQFSPRDIVVLFSGFLGILLAGYLFRYPGNNRRAGQLLASFLILQGFMMLVTVFLYRHILFLKLEQTFRWLFYLESTALLVDGFLLYAYCSVLLFNSHFGWKRLVYHFVPALTLAVLSLLVYHHADVLSYFDPTASDRSPEVGFVYGLMQVARAYYGWMCLGLLAKYQSDMARQFSNPHKPDVVWLLRLIKGLVATRFAWVFCHAYFTAAALFSWYMLNYKYLIGGCLFLLDAAALAIHIGLLYFGLKYSPQFLSLSSEPPFSPTKPVPIDSTLVAKLEGHITQTRLYTNPELRLDDLASTLHQPARSISMLINQHYQTNFCDFINGYRIEAAKQLLSKQGRVNVLDISLQVGFNSKSAFNRAFKKATQMTPLNYRKQQGVR